MKPFYRATVSRLIKNNQISFHHITNQEETPGTEIEGLVHPSQLLCFQKWISETLKLKNKNTKFR